MLLGTHREITACVDHREITACVDHREITACVDHREIIDCVDNRENTARCGYKVSGSVLIMGDTGWRYWSLSGESSDMTITC